MLELATIDAETMRLRFRLAGVVFGVFVLGYFLIPGSHSVSDTLKSSQAAPSPRENTDSVYPSRLQAHIRSNVLNALEINRQSKTLHAWVSSGFLAEDVFANARDLGAERALCDELARLSDVDLSLFDSSIREENSVGFRDHCKDALMTRLERYWKVSRENLLSKLSEGPQPPARRPLHFCFHGGPHPEHTPKILSFLKKSGIKASFFVSGERAQWHPLLVKRIQTQGHALGALGHEKLDLTWVSEHTAKKVVKKTQETFESLMDGKSKLKSYYFPFGRENDLLRQMVTGLGLTVHAVHQDSLDWKTPDPTALFELISERMKESSSEPLVIEFHDRMPQTWIALEHLIPTAQFKKVAKSF